MIFWEIGIIYKMCQLSRLLRHTKLLEFFMSNLIWRDWFLMKNYWSLCTDTQRLVHKHFHPTIQGNLSSIYVSIILYGITKSFAAVNSDNLSIKPIHNSTCIIFTYQIMFLFLHLDAVFHHDMCHTHTSIDKVFI